MCLLSRLIVIIQFDDIRWLNALLKEKNLACTEKGQGQCGGSERILCACLRDQERRGQGLHSVWIDKGRHQGHDVHVAQTGMVLIRSAFMHFLLALFALQINVAYFFYDSTCEGCFLDHLAVFCAEDPSQRSSA